MRARSGSGASATVNGCLCRTGNGGGAGVARWQHRHCGQEEHQHRGHRQCAGNQGGGTQAPQAVPAERGSPGRKPRKRHGRVLTGVSVARSLPWWGEAGWRAGAGQGMGSTRRTELIHGTALDFAGKVVGRRDKDRRIHAVAPLCEVVGVDASNIRPDRLNGVALRADRGLFGPGGLGQR